MTPLVWFTYARANVPGTTDAVWNAFDVLVNCSEVEYKQITPTKGKYFQIPLQEAKGQKLKICNQLPTLLDFFEELIHGKQYKVLLHSINGTLTTHLVINPQI